MKRVILALPLLLVAGWVGCRGGNKQAQVDTIKIAAYSVVREAIHDGIAPAFTKYWQAKTGRTVRFEESYNASGAQARAVAAGFDADLAILSHEGDMDALVKAGRVAKNWRSQEHGGIVTHSVVAIGYRDGNPKQISDWADLARAGVGVLYADPKTSGGARWNINAIYGSAWLADEKLDQDARIEAARHRLSAVQGNVVNMDASGRQSMANFAERQIGDAVVTYENELLLRAKQGKPIPFLVPSSTLLIESPAAVVESSVNRHGNKEVVDAFVAFLHSSDGQQILADYGFRPVEPAIAARMNFKTPAKLFRMSDLGGWEKVQDELYGRTGLWTAIFDEHVRRR